MVVEISMEVNAGSTIRIMRNTATALATARTIGGASFDGSGNIDVKVKTVSDETSNADRFLTFVDSTTTDDCERYKRRRLH